ERLPVRRLEVDGRAGDEVMALRIALVDNRAVGTEVVERRLRAELPPQPDHLRDARLDAGDLDALAEGTPVAAADAGDCRRDAAPANRVGRLRRPGQEDVLRGQCVVGV